MGLFTRMADIAAAHLNRLLDRVETPERRIAQLIGEMEEALAAARRQTAAAIAAERRLSRELERTRLTAALWDARARAMLAAGRDDLARRALLRKRECDDLAQALEGQHAAALQTGENARASLLAFEARLRAVRVRREMAESAGRERSAVALPQAELERLESRICTLEDELAARGEVDDILGRVKGDPDELADREIDRELAALKRQARERNFPAPPGV
jgi:phage shock protein A